MSDPRPGQASRTVLVTGANGFVGRALTRALTAEGRTVSAATRMGRATAEDVRATQVGDIGGDTDWTGALRGCDAIVHLAARVHVLHDQAADPLAAYRAVNVAGTVALARQAVRLGVRRFVFISSIKVNGEETRPEAPFREDDVPAPVDPYGVSKLEAERALQAIAAESALEVVILRPSLIYGPGVRANFLSMVRWLASGVPLPLGALRENRRSLVALDNLVDLIQMSLDHPEAANQVFLAADGEDLSTTDLLRRTARAMGVRPRLVAVPPRLLAFGAHLLGKDALMQRLAGSLQVDGTRARRILGWRPPIGVDEGLRRTVQALEPASA